MVEYKYSSWVDKVVKDRPSTHERLSIGDISKWKEGCGYMLNERNLSFEELQKYIIDTTSFGMEELSDVERKERESCVKQAKEDIDKLLPEGINTVNNKIKEYVDEEGSIVGALWTTVRKEEDYLLLAMIHVKEEQRGKGYGKKLMDLVIEEAKEKYLELVALGVYKTNETAISLYKKCGFIIFDEEDSRYSMLRQVREDEVY